MCYERWCVFYYCRTYYKAVRVRWTRVCVFYYCRTDYKAVRVGVCLFFKDKPLTSRFFSLVSLTQRKAALRQCFCR